MGRKRNVPQAVESGLSQTRPSLFDLLVALFAALALEKRWSQEDFADRASVHPDLCRRHGAGRRNPTTTTLEKLAKTLRRKLQC